MSKTRIFTVITLYVFMISCIDQENKREKQEVINETNNQSSLNSTQFLNFDNQISEVVRTVFQDSKGNIWFGTQDGAFKHNGESLIHVDSIKSELGRGVTIKGITEDKDGRIWFGHTGGVSLFDGESITNYYESDGLLSNDVWCITIDKKNQIWIGTIEGVCKFDGKNFTKFNIPEGKLDTTRGISSTKMVHNIMEDSQGRIWFSTNGGIYIKDDELLSNISEKDGLRTSFVNQVMEDYNGSFWISTSKGLFHYTDKTLENITEGITENLKGTGSIMQDSDGNIWFNSNLRDIYCFNGRDFSKYKIEDGDYGPAPFQIYEDQQKRIWLVGYGGAYRYENETFVNITNNGPW